MINFIKNIFKKKKQPITAIYFHDGKEFFREEYPFRRRYKKGQMFIMNSIGVQVLNESMVGNTYFVSCSKRF